MPVEFRLSKLWLFAAQSKLSFSVKIENFQLVSDNNNRRFISFEVNIVLKK